MGPQPSEHKSFESGKESNGKLVLNSTLCIKHVSLEFEVGHFLESKREFIQLVSFAQTAEANQLGFQFENMGKFSREFPLRLASGLLRDRLFLHGADRQEHVDLVNDSSTPHESVFKFEFQNHVPRH